MKQEGLEKSLDKKEIEGHYELPEGWRWVRLGEVIQEALPGFACGKRAGGEGFVQLRMNNISIRGQIDLSSILRVPATYEQVEKYRLVSGDVIFNNTNSVELVGKTILFEEEKGTFLYSNHLTRLRPKPEFLDSYYLASWLQLLWHQRVFELMCNRWIGQAAVQREKLLNLEIPLPPFPVQQRLSTKLQALMQGIELAHTACKKQLEAAKALPAAYLREVFESEEAKKWERKRLGEVLKEPLKNGLNYGIEDFGVGIKFVNVLDIFCPSIIDTKKLERINVSPKDVKKYQLQTGDILIVRSSLKKEGVAYPALFIEDEEPVVFCGFLIRIRPDKEKIESLYLLHYLRSSISREKLVGDSDTATITNVDQGTLLSLEIPLPPLLVQQRLASYLQEKISQAEKLRIEIEKQLETINALPQAFLRKAFRGEL